jgi:hypothetical protein
MLTRSLKLEAALVGARTELGVDHPVAARVRAIEDGLKPGKVYDGQPAMVLEALWTIIDELNGDEKVSHALATGTDKLEQTIAPSLPPNVQAAIKRMLKAIRILNGEDV